MTIRFFILQTHYRSTLDFSNEALQAAEKGLRRLWEAYAVLDMLESDPSNKGQKDEALEQRVRKLLDEMPEFMSDDFNTAKVLANFFELVPVINSMKDGHLQPGVLGPETMVLMKERFRIYLEDIFGLKEEQGAAKNTLEGVVKLLIDVRREAKARKDYMTSDKIRNQLLELGIQLKDEKNGDVSWGLV
jgi:cysteinyl-tRNA synthetase